MIEDGVALDARIELKGLLGTGGMGEVHRAWDTRLERAVAVKFFLSASPRQADRLLLEGRLQARVEHPHVVRVLESGSLNGRPCLVLQLVEGRSLATAASGLSLADKVELVRQAALGLHAAHLQGLVHRDVKPGNILVEEGGGRPQALVTDFGLARAEEAGLTRSGVPAGTLAFMSPEQLLGAGPVTYRADVYGLGATLYATLAGAAPLLAQRVPGTLAEAGSDALLPQILDEPPPLSPEVPRALARVVAKAMQKEPSARYESAAALADDLARFQRGEPVLARPAPAAERALAWTRRNRTATRALGVALSAVMAAGTWAAWTQQRASAEALDAARLGALGEALETRLRMEYLSPAHDLRPALAKVRAEVGALRPIAARGGGPSNFALAKGLELVGDIEGARTAYERAWAAGFRTTRVAEGLGSALAASYERASQRAVESLDPAAREARLKALQAELRDRGVRLLKQAGAEGWRAAYLSAEIALLEGDTAAARARADEVLSLEPGRYEARLLQARAWLADSLQLSGESKGTEAVAAADRALPLLEEATLFGRSDPAVARMRLRVLIQRLTVRERNGGAAEADIAPVREAIARAAALDPDAPATVLGRARLANFEAVRAQRRGLAFSAPPLAEAVAGFRHAAELDGEEISTITSLLGALAFRIHVLIYLGEKGELPAVIEEGRAVAKRALARSPFDAGLLSIACKFGELEARALRALDRPQEEALRRSIEAGEAALRVGVRDSPRVRFFVGEARENLARALWGSGKDPRPELASGIGLLEEVVAAAGGDETRTNNLAGAHGTAAELLRPMGADASAHIARQGALCVELLARHPGDNFYLGNRFAALVIDAWAKVDHGEDPEAELVEADRLWKMRHGAQDDLWDQEQSVLPHYLRARRDGALGRDPTPHLAEVDRGLRPMVARGSQVAADVLARGAVERALWERRNGRNPVEAARRGLEDADRAIQARSREPELWAVKSRLLSLAGDRAAAKQALERAWSMNALVRGGYESKQAEAELAR